MGNKSKGSSCREALRMLVSVGLAALLAFDALPVPALAEAEGELTAVEVEAGQELDVGASDGQTEGPLVEEESVGLSAEELARNLSNPSDEDSHDVSADAGETDDRLAIDPQVEDEVVALDNEDSSASGKCGNCTWSIDVVGKLTVSPMTGTDGQLSDSGVDFPWAEYREQIKTVEFQKGVRLPSKCTGMFSRCSSLSSLDVSGWDTSQVTTMSYMFYGCSSLPSLNLSNWDTSQVTAMGYMFYDCASLSSLDVSGWDTSSVEDMCGMFCGCSSLSSLDLSDWNTSKVTDMGGMFYGCSSLASLKVGKDYAIKSAEMFPDATAANYGWWSETDKAWYFKDTIVSYRSGVADTYLNEGEESQANAIASGMWGNCPWAIDKAGKLTVSFIPGNDGQLADSAGFDEYFPWCEYGAKIKSAEFQDGVRLPPDCEGMFLGCENLTSLDVSGWDTSQVTSTANMFAGCSSLPSLDVSDWDTSKVTDMSGMFQDCSSLTSLDVSDWDTSRVMYMSGLFHCCSSLTSLDAADWDTSKVENMFDMFFGCSSLASLNAADWDTSKVTNMSDMFQDCSSLASLDVSGWDTSKVENMRAMFDGCSSLTSLDVSDWDTSKVTEMYDMFYRCSSLASLDVSGWDTSKVENMRAMFGSCAFLSSLDVSDWDTSKVEDMGLLFYGCSSLVSLDVSGWDTSQVTEMGWMFLHCSSLASLKLGEDYVIKSEEMFPAALSGYGWWSTTDQRWCSKDEIVSSRSGVADTYCSVTSSPVANPLCVRAVKATQNLTYKPGSAQSLEEYDVFEVTGARGAVTFSKKSGNAGITVTSAGKVTLQKALAVGSYRVVFNVTAAGDANYKAATKTVTVTFEVNKAANPMTASAAKASVSTTYKPSATTVLAKNVTVTKAQGTVTYANASSNATAKKFTVDKTSGKVTIPKATKAGTYVVRVTATAVGNANYKAGAKTVSYKVVVNKAANPVVPTAVARTAPFATLRSKAVTVVKPIMVRKAQGSLSFAKVASGSSKYLTVNKSTGKVTVKQGTKKGTYTIKIKVTAAGNANYKAKSIIVACKVTVK